MATAGLGRVDAKFALLNQQRGRVEEGLCFQNFAVADTPAKCRLQSDGLADLPLSTLKVAAMDIEQAPDDLTLRDDLLGRVLLEKILRRYFGQECNHVGFASIDAAEAKRTVLASRCGFPDDVLVERVEGGADVGLPPRLNDV